MTQEICNGIVKRFFLNKGFGFITPEAGGDDVFFHYSQIKEGKSSEVREGQKVSYTVVRGDKGFHANDVSLLD